MKKLTKLRPPKSLSTEAKCWWSQLQSEYAITDRGGLLILGAAAEAFDRMREAKSLVNSEGMVVLDRWGQQKPHPAVVIERDARSQMLAALKQLHLDIEPLQNRSGRPTGLK